MGITTTEIAKELLEFTGGDLSPGKMVAYFDAKQKKIGQISGHQMGHIIRRAQYLLTNISINDTINIKYEDLRGPFTLIKRSGGRYHMFSNDLGQDLLLTKTELIKAKRDYDASK